MFLKKNIATKEIFGKGIKKKESQNDSVFTEKAKEIINPGDTPFFVCPVRGKVYVNERGGAFTVGEDGVKVFTLRARIYDSYGNELEKPVVLPKDLTEEEPVVYDYVDQSIERCCDIDYVNGFGLYHSKLPVSFADWALQHRGEKLLHTYSMMRIIASESAGWMSKDSICRLTGMVGNERRTVLKRVRQLIDLGWVEVSPTSGKYRVLSTKDVSELMGFDLKTHHRVPVGDWAVFKSWSVAVCGERVKDNINNSSQFKVREERVDNQSGFSIAKNDWAMTQLHKDSFALSLLVKEFSFSQSTASKYLRKANDLGFISRKRNIGRLTYQTPDGATRTVKIKTEKSLEKWISFVNENPNRAHSGHLHPGMFRRNPKTNEFVMEYPSLIEFKLGKPTNKSHMPLLRNC